MKRAKIIDSDNEEGEGEGQVNQPQPLIDTNEDSDEGIRDDVGHGYVFLAYFILIKHKFSLNISFVYNTEAMILLMISKR